VRLKKPSPRPIVSLPLASRFNDAVSMDLKFWGSKFFLVIVDIATRYCTSIVIDNKKPSTIIRGIFLSWVVIFGTPKKILSDNGCEFNNSEMRDFGERFNIKMMTTAAESPWSNGVCERQNAVIADGVRKVIADTNCTVDVALAWTVSARNCLANHSGFSPNQLVFGQNPALPNVFSDKPPALEEHSSSDIVRINLTAMHAARQEFVKFESNEKLRRALRHNIRATDSTTIENGEEVFYKRNDSPEWRGPGVVIGRDGKQFLVKHGGTYVRVHECRISRAAVPAIEENSESSSRSVSTPSDGVSTQVEEAPVPRLGHQRCFYEDSEDEIPLDHSSGAIASEDVEEIMDTPLNDLRDGNESSSTANDVNAREPNFQVKVGQRIKGVSTDSGELLSGKVICRAGKASGRYKHWFNVKLDDGRVQAVDVKDGLSNLEVVQENVEMVVFFNTEEVNVAKHSELKSWVENDVYEEVENTGQNAISVRWVVTEKIKDGATVVKARLVARGYEENTENLRTDSPTCSKEAVRLAISVASSKAWECHTIDVKSAYLQGNPIEREIFLKPPPEVDQGTLWKLQKTVYGLSDAARH